MQTSIKRNIQHSIDVLTGEVVYYKMPSGLLIKPNADSLEAKLAADEIREAIADWEAGIESPPVLTGGLNPPPQIKEIYRSLSDYHAGIDAIRLSVQGINDDWMRLVKAYQAEFLQENKPKHYKARGGWKGLRIGPFQVEELDDRHHPKDDSKRWYAVKCEGNGWLCERIMQDFGPMSTNCSRFDIQLTTFHHVHDGALPKALFEFRVAQELNGDKLSAWGKPPSYDCIVGAPNKGDTFYLGARVKKTRVKGRIYDKHAQSGGQIPYSYRFEVEFHEDYSQSLFEQFLHKWICTSDEHGLGGQILPTAQDCAALVRMYFDSKYVPMPEIDAKTEFRYFAQKVVTSVDKSIQWLKYQVAPTIRWLHQKIKLELLMNVLGLESVVLGEQNPSEIEPEPEPMTFEERFVAPNLHQIWDLAVKRKDLHRKRPTDLRHTHYKDILNEFHILLSRCFRVTLREQLPSGKDYEQLTMPSLYTAVYA